MLIVLIGMFIVSLCIVEWFALFAWAITYPVHRTGKSRSYIPLADMLYYGFIIACVLSIPVCFLVFLSSIQ
jgi:hypothetical protein